MVDDDPNGFNLIFMTTFFYAAATGAHSPKVGEYMKESRRITGLVPETGNLRPGLTH